LQELGLANTQVTDAGLKELAGLTKLQTLDLRGTKVSDAGLKELTGLNSLRSLDLNETRVTDAGLMQLKALKKLKWLRLWKTEVTDAGVKALKEALPGVSVDREDPFPELKSFLRQLDPPNLGLRPIGKPTAPVHREKVRWDMILAIGAIGAAILVAAAAVGFYKARRRE
jgi:hypothetical protein